MKKNNNIVTFNFGWSKTNYGAILTNYALHKIIQQNKYAPILYMDKDFVQDTTCKKQNIFKNFENNIRTINVDNIFEINQKSNIFIAGSDQVFRIFGLKERSYLYLLDFAKVESKKIAISASFGVDKKQFLKENSEEIIEHMQNSLKSFDFISVREKSGVEICKDVLGVNAEWIIDPVFIYNNWEKLLTNATQNYKGKIVSYVLDKGNDYPKAYKHLSKKYNFEVVETANSNISVENWLKSIKDCELFVTDSFHGMCFAIIFNKPFICLANKSRGRSRFDSICEMLGIENQCVDSILEVLERDCVFKVNYEKVNEQIEKERKRGLEFLHKALEAPIQINQAKIDSRMTYLENRVIELEKECNLKTQLKKSAWNLWLNIFYRLPKFVQNIIQFLRGKRGN